jgi:transposase
MRAYSMDLRDRVLAAVDRGTPREEIVRSLGVSQPTIRRYLRLRRETGSVAPKPLPKRSPRVGGTAEQRRALWAQLEANPEATLEEHREMWKEQHGVRVSVATMSRAIRRLGWTYKKRRWEPPNEMNERGVLGKSG